MKRMKVRLTFLTPALGTCSANPEIHREFVASKAATKQAMDEEVESLENIDPEEEFEKSMTIFPQLDDGTLFIWDYQIRGALKSAASALKRCAGEDFAKATNKLKAHKKIVDTCIFCEPRKIPIDTHGGEVTYLQRPLRAETPQGSRVALATSQAIPVGSTVTFEIICLSDSYEDAVREWLDYGKWVGLLQWRGSGGYGRYAYEILDDAGNVIGGNKGYIEVA